MSYPNERKESVLKKMLPPQSHSIPELARAEGISEATLYAWRKAARAGGRLLPNDAQTPEGWTSAEKFAAVVETAALNAIELAAYSRHRGLYPAQLHAWRQACEQAMIGTGVSRDGSRRPAKRISSRSNNWAES